MNDNTPIDNTTIEADFDHNTDISEIPTLSTWGIRRILIGMLFIFLNFRIMGFDIIPDFIGYGFIISGTKELMDYGASFRFAKVFACIALIFSFADFYQITYPLGQQPDELIYYSLTVGLLQMCILLGLDFAILKGIASMGVLAGNTDIPLQSKTMLFFIFAERLCIYPITIYILLFGNSGGSETSALTFLTIGIALTIAIAYMLFLKSVRNRLDGVQIISKESDNVIKGIRYLLGTVAFFTSILLFGIGIFISDSNTLLFTYLNYPKVYQQSNIDYRLLKKDEVSALCRLSSDINNEAYRLDNNQDHVDRIRVFLEKISKLAEQTQINTDNNDMFMFGNIGGNGFQDNYDDADPWISYIVTIENDYNIITIEFNNKTRQWTVGNVACSLNDSIFEQLETITHELFDIK